jgi:hypothetical protein
MFRSTLTAVACGPVHLSVALVVALVAGGATTSAATLIGTSVTGSVKFGINTRNYFDASNSFVPPTGFLNSPPGTPTVTIASPAIEYGFGFGSDTKISADFGANTLTLSEQIPAALLEAQHFTFTDSAFAGLSLTETSDTFSHGGVTGTLVGNTLSIEWPGGPIAAPQHVTAVFTFSVPEPASLGLLGIAAVTLTARRPRRPQSRSTSLKSFAATRRNA